MITTQLFVTVAIKSGHAAIPIGTISEIVDIDDVLCRVVYDTSQGSVLIETKERAGELCYRINRLLDNHVAGGNKALLDARARGQA